MLRKNQICYFLALVITDLHTIMCIQFYFLFAIWRAVRFSATIFFFLSRFGRRIGSHITI